MQRWLAIGLTAWLGAAHAGDTQRWLHIEVRGVGANESGAIALTPKLLQLITDDLNHSPVPVFATAPAKGYGLHSTITRLSRHTADGIVEITCEVSLMVEQLPSHSMVMMTSSGATVQTPAASFRPDQERALQVHALEGAVHDAHQTFMEYLTAQR